MIPPDSAEQRVCELFLTGLSNKEIAHEHGRAEATIKNQVATILSKNRVPSRAVAGATLVVTGVFGG